MDTLFAVKLPSMTISVMTDDVDDIMDTAMMGCTYWCESAKPVEGYLGRYASEQIAKDGTLKFFPFEDEPVDLTLDKFKAGLDKWLQSLDDVSRVVEGNRIEPANIDAEDADCILQYALFDELIYG